MDNNTIFLTFPSKTTSLGRNSWCTWIDPKTYQSTDDFENAVGVGLVGSRTINVADLMVLCYLSHPSSTKQQVKDLAYLTGGYYQNQARLDDYDRIVLKLNQAVARLKKDKHECAGLVEQQLPVFLEKSALWYGTLIEAPEREIRKAQDQERKRRPETYAKLQEQADNLYRAQRKTLHAMQMMKIEMPELPSPRTYV